MANLRYTAHARERYHQRIQTRGVGNPNNSIPLPSRYLAPRYRGRLARYVTYRVTACALWVVKGGSVATCLRLRLEDTATVLVWAMLGAWPEGSLIDPEPDGEVLL